MLVGTSCYSSRETVYFDMDTLIDEVAQHLGIHRSGSRLLRDSQLLRNALLK